MGVIYYAVNDEKKQIALLGKWSWVLHNDHDTGQRVLNTSDEVLQEYDGTVYEDSWRRFVTALRELNCTRIVDDCVDDIDEFDDYVIVATRHSYEDFEFVGKTLAEYYR